jgi:hypothetical protein
VVVPRRKLGKAPLVAGLARELGFALVAGLARELGFATRAFRQTHIDVGALVTGFAGELGFATRAFR